MNSEIKVVEYDPKWKEAFAAEKKLISRIIGKGCVGIYHIGSTAVKGMASRPILDILAVVKDVSAIDSIEKEFEAAGYVCCGEMGINGRRYFQKGEPCLTHTLQIFSRTDTQQINRHIALRDYFRSHPDKAKEYSDLKTELARTCTDEDCAKYGDGKSGYLDSTEKDALKWSEDEQRRTTFLSIGMCLGMSLGMCFGSVFGSTSTGMCMGMCIGMGIGIALGSYKKP